MGDLVYNEAGADEAMPCPTTASMFFDDPKCTRGDYRKWRRAAANLYELGILALWDRLLQVEQAQGSTAQAVLLAPPIEAYKRQYDALPVRGSAFSPQRNATLIATTIALMLDGEKIITALRESLITLGVIAPPLSLPPRPTQPELHSAWRAYAWHIGIGVAVLSVGALTVWAVLAARGSDAS